MRAKHGAIDRGLSLLHQAAGHPNQIGTLKPELAHVLEHIQQLSHRAFVASKFAEIERLRADQPALLRIREEIDQWNDATFP
jgi:hypothetical protein